jgi:hypothetical protein
LLALVLNILLLQVAAVAHKTMLWAVEMAGAVVVDTEPQPAFKSCSELLIP